MPFGSTSKKRLASPNMIHFTIYVYCNQCFGQKSSVAAEKKAKIFNCVKTKLFSSLRFRFPEYRRLVAMDRRLVAMATGLVAVATVAADRGLFDCGLLHFLIGDEEFGVFGLLLGIGFELIWEHEDIKSNFRNLPLNFVSEKLLRLRSEST